MHGLIDVCAETLRAGAPVFTERNLYFAARRARGAALTEAAFEAALRRRLRRGPLPGLVRTRSRARAGDEAPAAVLLIDRPATLELFVALEVRERARLAVVCVDGTPRSVVARLARGFEAGLRPPVLYVHDAATVVYPFALEPLATLVRQQDHRPLVYRDLGLPPLGAGARRFHDPALPGDEPILELEAIPPATLLRYVMEALSRVDGGAGAPPSAARTCA